MHSVYIYFIYLYINMYIYCIRIMYCCEKISIYWYGTKTKKKYANTCMYLFCLLHYIRLSLYDNII